MARERVHDGRCRVLGPAGGALKHPRAGGGLLQWPPATPARRRFSQSLLEAAAGLFFGGEAIVEEPQRLASSSESWRRRHEPAIRRFSKRRCRSVSRLTGPTPPSQLTHSGVTFVTDSYKLDNMLRKWTVLVVVVSCSASNCAVAACSLSDFGNHVHPPETLRPQPVDNTYASFSYGSDVWTDQTNGVYYAWNFIRNNSNRILPVQWDKGGINQVAAPIEVGASSCVSNPIAVVSEHPDLEHYIDHDAPIFYSSATIKQEAWAYVEPVAASSSGASAPNEGKKEGEGLLQQIFSKFNTDYVDPKGITHSVDVTIASAFSSASLQIEVRTTTPDLKLGIANLQNLLGYDKVEAAAEQFKKQGFTVRETTLAEMVGPDAARVLLSGNEEASKSTFLFLSGQKGGKAIIALSPDLRIDRRRSTMVMLDQDGGSLATAINLYGLTAQ
jgi:hypothetical protein